MSGPPNTGKTLLTGAVLLALTLAIAFGAWRVEHRQHQRSLRLHAGWRQQNTASLLALSAVKGPSAEEGARLHRAGDDPEQLRQALIEIQALRLAYANRDLDDAQRRRAELESAGRHNGTGLPPAQAELAQLAKEDAAHASAEIAIYQRALRNVKQWQPISYQSYLASRSVHGTPAANPPARVAVARPKPDPRGPAGTESPAVSVAPRQAPPAVAFPSQADVAEAAQHPSVTVYAEDDPVAQERNATEDIANRQQAEQAMETTLRRWSQAMTLNNPHAEAAEYAPHMDRYFLRSNVDRAFVEADKAAYLRRGNLTASFALQDVRFENETPDAADVRLVKDVTWEQSTAGATHKLIRSRLHLVRTGAGWKIDGEQDFR